VFGRPRKFGYQISNSLTAGALAVIAPTVATMVVPAMVADLGEAAALQFIVTANIHNPNTRAVYAVAVRGFFRWLETRGAIEVWFADEVRIGQKYKITRRLMRRLERYGAG
jgi:hypothetical protein